MRFAAAIAAIGVLFGLVILGVLQVTPRLDTRDEARRARSTPAALETVVSLV